jgi:hypothetical protein
MKFRSSGDEGRPELLDKGPLDDYFDWVSFSPSKFEAPPDQWITVKMTIAVPPTAGLGYYYAVTFSRSVDQISEENATVVGKTASLILLDVKSPNQKPSLKLTSFHTSRKLFEYLPTNFDLKINNNGNIHLSPVGNIFISRGSKQVATLSVNSAGGNILPDSNRIFTTEWNDGFPIYTPKVSDDKPVTDKNGQPVRQLKWNFDQISKLRFGKYTAHLVMVYNDGERDVPLEATVQFWVIPWRLILMIVLVPIIPSILVYVYMRRRMRRVVNKAGFQKIDVHRKQQPKK